MTKRYYLTTAIDYVNGQPHLGHAYEKIVTDVLARARRSFGHETFFLTGLDEHGQKVQQAAQAEGKEAAAYCDELALSWKSFAARLNLSNNDFIRTSEPRHRNVVQAILRKLHSEGHFYKAQYTGFYSTRQESFLTDKDRRPDGTFDPFYGEVVELVEENYYFKLSRHQEWLLQYIRENENFIIPNYRRNEVLGFLENNTLEDLCITRPVSRLNWGIPLPFDPEYVTYVWFDALVNYISAPAAHGDPAILDALQAFSPDLPPPSELSLWPADAHVIGKDILKFHAVYWPIMLKAIGVPLPKQIIAHGWWQKDGHRMSKTTGNTVDPISVIEEWGLDAFRYYVVRELDLGPDGNWTDAGFQSRYQAELANGLGNLVNRSISMLRRYRDGIVPGRSNELEAEASTALAKIRTQLESSHLQGALMTIWNLIARANQYVDQTAPFKLAKDPSQSARLDDVLYNLAEICRILAVLLWPFLPDTAAKIYSQLRVDGSPDQFSDAAWGGLVPGHVIGDPVPLFPRKDLAPKGA